MSFFDDNVYRKVDIKRLHIIPEIVLDNCFKKINNTQLTFGVHTKENSKHSKRDIVSNKPLHKAFYGNGKNVEPVDNAQLLKQVTDGFSTVVYVENIPVKLKNIPPRPIIQPMLKMQIDNGFLKNKFTVGLKEQLSLRNTTAIDLTFNKIKNEFTTQKVKNFVENGGFSFWNSKAKHNNPYVAAVKLIDELGEEGLGNVYNNKDKLINFMSKWSETFNYQEGDKPLVDSMDLINSIKVRVNKL